VVLPQSVMGKPSVLAVPVKYREQVNFDRIMQTTIQELGLALGATRSYIQLGPTDAQEDKALE